MSDKKWISVITLFPEMFDSISRYGVSSRAINDGTENGGEGLDLSFVNPRDFSEDKHQTVDDRPFGGGPGMVMKVEPLSAALSAARKAASNAGFDGDKAPRVIYMSPQGKRLDQVAVNELSSQSSLILIAGRYEGVDERFIEAEVDEEWSIGDYVLSGGELACMVLLDCIIRQLPGVLGHEASAKFDSFAEGNQGLLDCPHYTRPEEILGKKVPEVLLSGHHENIHQWRLKQSLQRTLERRPDILVQLLEAGQLDEEVKGILEQFLTEYESSSDDIKMSKSGASVESIVERVKRFF